MDKKFLKLLVLIGMVLYVVSPIDVCPGPVDDAIVIIIGNIVRSLLTERRRKGRGEIIL